MVVTHYDKLFPHWGQLNQRYFNVSSPSSRSDNKLHCHENWMFFICKKLNYISLLFVKIPSYLLYVWLLSFFVLVNKNNLNSKVIPNPSIYSCKLQFKWTSNQSIIVFKKSNTPLLPRWFGPRYSLSWVLSWDVSLALENFYTSSILKNEWKRNQYTSKVGWYS